MHRRSLALAAGALLLLPALASCGFDYPTDRINTNGAGVTNRDAEVDVLGAVIVAGQPDAGTLVATFSNNTEDEISFETVSGDVQADGLEPIGIGGGDFVNLADNARAGKGILVSGEFEAGDFVPMTFGFSNGENVDVDIPVVKACYEYVGLDDQGTQAASQMGEDFEKSDAEAASEDEAYSCVETPDGHSETDEELGEGEGE